MTPAANSCLEIMMPDVQIDRNHCGAICVEIGERLSVAMGPQSNELAAPLLALIDELVRLEPREAPSEVRRDLIA